HEVRPEGIHVMSVIPGIVATRFREHVLSGDTPEGVADIKRTISPESVADSIVAGLLKGKKTVVNPRIGWAFWGVDILFPGLMHRYMRRRWAVRGTATAQRHA